VGVGLGLGVCLDISLTKLAVTISRKVHSTYITNHFGFKYAWNSKQIGSYLGVGVKVKKCLFPLFWKIFLKLKWNSGHRYVAKKQTETRKQQQHSNRIPFEKGRCNYGVHTITLFP
jgi:hypothetical protein